MNEALSLGISPGDFWDMSARAIFTLRNERIRRAERMEREKKKQEKGPRLKTLPKP